MIKAKPEDLHLLQRHWEQVEKILHQYLPTAEVWAYGSRVNGDHYDASDLDLVVRRVENLSEPQQSLSAAREAFSESNLPIVVQLTDWACIPDSFREEIAARYIVIQSSK